MCRKVCNFEDHKSRVCVATCNVLWAPWASVGNLATCLALHRRGMCALLVQMRCSAASVVIDEWAHAISSTVCNIDLKSFHSFLCEEIVVFVFVECSGLLFLIIFDLVKCTLAWLFMCS